MDVKLVLPLLFRKALTWEHTVVGKKTLYVSVGCIYEFLKNLKQKPTKTVHLLVMILLGLLESTKNRTKPLHMLATLMIFLGYINTQILSI